MLTPIDIDNKTFKKTKFGGYDINDVEDFLVTLMEDYEMLYKENSELRDKVVTLQDSVSYYKTFEEDYNKVKMMDLGVDKSATNTFATIGEEIESPVEEVDNETQSQLEDLKSQMKSVEEDIQKARQEMDAYKSKMTSVLEAQLKALSDNTGMFNLD